MDATKAAIDKMKAEGMKFEGFNRLELAKKDEAGIPQSTGRHFLRLLKDEARDDVRIYKSPNSFKEVDGIRYWFDEGGVEKYYEISLLDKEEEKPHYLLQKMAEFKPGDEIVMEYIRKGNTGFIDVQSKGDMLREESVPSDSVEVKPEDIPF